MITTRSLNYIVFAMAILFNTALYSCDIVSELYGELHAPSAHMYEMENRILQPKAQVKLDQILPTEKTVHPSTSKETEHESSNPEKIDSINPCTEKFEDTASIEPQAKAPSHQLLKKIHCSQTRASKEKEKECTASADIDPNTILHIWHSLYPDESPFSVLQVPPYASKEEQKEKIEARMETLFSMESINNNDVLKVMLAKKVLPAYYNNPVYVMRDEKIFTRFEDLYRSLDPQKSLEEQIDLTQKAFKLLDSYPITPGYFCAFFNLMNKTFKEHVNTASFELASSFKQMLNEEKKYCIRMENHLELDIGIVPLASTYLDDIKKLREEITHIKKMLKRTDSHN